MTRSDCTESAEEPLIVAEQLFLACGWRCGVRIGLLAFHAPRSATGSSPVPAGACRAPSAGHATAGFPSSFGRRMRLQAVAEKAKAMSTRSRPRMRMRRNTPNSLPQPKPSSIRLRMRWITA